MADDPHPLDALNARGLTAKREYVRGLEQRRDPEALSLLVECLCDESWFLRDLAEQTFVRMGEEHAGPLLPLLVGGLWYTRLSAARLLGRLGYRPAVPALLELCDDTNETASLAARDALVAVARQRGATRLAHALRRIEPERRKRRLAEIAERDRTVAKNLERLMADADLMSAEDPDRLVDPEEAGRSGEKSGPAPSTSAAARPPAPRSHEATAPAAAPGSAAPKPATAPASAPKRPATPKPPAPATAKSVESATPKPPAPARPRPPAPARPKPPEPEAQKPMENAGPNRTGAPELELGLPAPAASVPRPPAPAPSPTPPASTPEPPPAAPPRTAEPPSGG